MQDRIGIVAGNIWKKLERDGEMSPRKLSTATKEKSDVVYLALGWLARENKVEFNATKSSFKVKIAGR
ncbi:MAG: winged helix-turn-helix domain-containing protein [Candidatus Zixiibacteriota bacterium]|nr:winged helix-turn-helix domain-containing protein [candidate division Zixibacteria bacterium]MBU1471874.1 winged helix-turn-helix domain-containing protein [candidate division Zixibacteria bacterium]